ncbi:MAG: hypothetical protein ABI843_03635 [Dokdonella sp.]
MTLRAKKLAPATPLLAARLVEHSIVREQHAALGQRLASNDS